MKNHRAGTLISMRCIVMQGKRNEPQEGNFGTSMQGVYNRRYEEDR